MKRQTDEIGEDIKVIKEEVEELEKNKVKFLQQHHEHCIIMFCSYVWIL